MLVTIDQLRQSLTQTQQVVESIERHFPRPALGAIGGEPLFRHKNQNDLLLSQLKCVRAVSSLNACIVLLDHGYVQEIGTLCRCIDDFYQDVLFLALSLSPYCCFFPYGGAITAGIRYAIAGHAL